MSSSMRFPRPFWLLAGPESVQPQHPPKRAFAGDPAAVLEHPGLLIRYRCQQGLPGFSVGLVVQPVVDCLLAARLVPVNVLSHLAGDETTPYPLVLLSQDLDEFRWSLGSVSELCGDAALPQVR